VKRFERRENVVRFYKLWAHLEFHTLDINQLNDIVPVFRFQDAPAHEFNAGIEIVHGQKLYESFDGDAPLFSVRVSIQVENQKVIGFETSVNLGARRIANRKPFHVNAML
jgi:hypothetical protein